MSLTKKDLEKILDVKLDLNRKKMERVFDAKLEQKLGQTKNELEAKIDAKFEESQNFMGVLVEDLEDKIKLVAEMVVQNTQDIGEIKQTIVEIKEELEDKINRSECLFLRKACVPR